MAITIFRVSRNTRGSAVKSKPDKGGDLCEVNFVPIRKQRCLSDNEFIDLDTVAKKELLAEPISLFHYIFSILLAHQKVSHISTLK